MGIVAAAGVVLGEQLADEGRRDDAAIEERSLQWSPNVGQVQDEASHRTLPDKLCRVAHLLRVAGGAIDVGGAMIGIEQPAELRAVIDPFLHFGLDCRQAV